MIRNYYKIAMRHLARSRFYAFINVSGLSIGIAATLLIAAYTWSERQVNRQLRHADRQYIITSNWKDPEMGYPVSTLGQLAPALKANYPSLVANFYRFDGVTSNVSYEDKHFREGLQIGDSTLITMYGLPMVAGDPHTALNDPFHVVITADIAIKYFGRTDVLGKSIVIENFGGEKKPFVISGVLEQQVRNSVTWLNMANKNSLFIPAVNQAWFGRNMDWANRYIVSYLELQPGVRPEALRDPVKHLIGTNTNKEVIDNLQVELHPLPDFYLEGNGEKLAGSGSTVQHMLNTLAVIAIFILVMAVVNFVNLSVSRSASRMREIGVRKVLGGLRRQLIFQFLTESVVMTLIASVIALVLYILFAPALTTMLGKQVPSLFALPAIAWVIIPIFALLIGAIAGLYPAFMLSAMPSVESLKGKRTFAANVLLTKGLAGFQFAIATIVLVGAIVIAQQIRLFFSDRLGYDKAYVVSAQLPRDWSEKGVRKMETVRDAFARLSPVSAATVSYEIPDGANGGTLPIYRNGDSLHPVTAQTLVTDEHYVETYKIPMVAGSFYNRTGESAAADSFRVVLNEQAVRALGFADAQAAVGQHIGFAGSGTPSPFIISGVVKDFHFSGMGSAIAPNVFLHVELARSYRYLSFKLRPGNIGATIGELQQQWSKILPGAPFEYKFMDQTLENLYTDELRLKKSVDASTVLAMIIVFSGVLGMVSISVQKRTKEIAIRKVIGASVPGIIRLFIKEFLPLLLIAGMVASPVAWWLMHSWLNDYVTRISLSPWPFAIAVGLLGVLMALLIAAQTLKAALMNPVASLKSE